MMRGHTRKSARDLLKIFGPVSLLTLAGFVVAYQFVDPAPPQRVALATGDKSGAYYLFGQRYREILARDRIELVVLPSAGSLENLALLETGDGGADLAFLQGGTGGAATTDDLVGLASLYFEPLWLFHRAEAPLHRLSELAGKRLAVGPEGSGTRAVALQLLQENGAHTPPTQLLPLGGGAAAEALLAGQVEAIFLVASPRSPVIEALLEAHGVALMSFARDEAYHRRHPFLSSVVLPEGVIDLQRNIPPHDVTLLAPTANLVARRALHPALVDLLLQAATEIHGGGGLFEAPGQFPSSRYLDLPQSKEAKRYFEYGPPFLQRVLPFWAATLVDRLKVMLLPLIALLLPFFKVMPPIYRWRVRSRIYRWYRELQAVDPVVHSPASAAATADGMAELARIEDEVAKVSIPLSYADELYDLRLHINLVRARLEAAGEVARPDGPSAA